MLVGLSLIMCGKIASALICSPLTGINGINLMAFASSQSTGILSNTEYHHQIRISFVRCNIQYIKMSKMANIELTYHLVLLLLPLPSSFPDWKKLFEKQKRKLQSVLITSVTTVTNIASKHYLWLYIQTVLDTIFIHLYLLLLCYPPDWKWFWQQQ
jgi:hypothetical protein